MSRSLKPNRFKEGNANDFNQLIKDFNFLFYLLLGGFWGGFDTGGSGLLTGGGGTEWRLGGSGNGFFDGKSFLTGGGPGCSDLIICLEDLKDFSTSFKY